MVHQAEGTKVRNYDLLGVEFKLQDHPNTFLTADEPFLKYSVD